MKTKMMSSGEAFTAVCNICEIERNLGHFIPLGCIDATDYGDRMLSGGEAFRIACNIREIEKNRRYDMPQQKYDLTPTGERICASVFVIMAILGWIVQLFGN